MSSKKETLSILIVEDNLFQTVVLEQIIKKLKHDVVGVAKSGEEAIQLAVELKPDLIFMDINLEGDMDGVTAAEKIQEKISAALIYVTGNSDAHHRKRAEKTDLLAFLVKPVLPSDIAAALDKYD